MTQVDFYILKNERANKRDQTLCQLVLKIHGLGHNIQIQTPNPAESERLDALLWTFQPNSFIPHEIDDGQHACSAPIRIHDGDRETPPLADVLINLSPSTPKQTSDHQRIVEIIDDNESHRQAGRQHYRHYQQLGLDIKTHELK